MKFSSKPIKEHGEVPLADDGQLEDAVAHWTQRAARREGRTTHENDCYVVSIGNWKESHSREAQLREIVSLVGAQGDRVVGSECVKLVRADRRTHLRSGSAKAVADAALGLGANMLVVDAELTPSQMRNLEDLIGMPVCDREGVILNVFLRHAKTQRARIQVEIAQLDYLRPLICGLGLQMDQQAGGIMGSRGPGETASELLARRLDGRLTELRRALKKVQQAGRAQRKGRDQCKRITLVGYTNAGKTSLMNGLASQTLSARDVPFETLDTTVRCLTRHGGDVLLSDTVGFIRRLPKRLLASFETTLAELQEATVLVVVVDASDPEWELHIETTQQMLETLNADRIPRFYVFNKMDRLTAIPTREDLRRRAGGHNCMLLSAKDPEAVTRLKELLIGLARADMRRASVLVPYEAADTMALVYRSCRVIEAETTETGLLFSLEAQPHVIARIQRATEGL